MAYETPKFSKGQINKAGDILRDIVNFTDSELSWAFDVLNNWRACHGYPINTFQATLRHRLKAIDPDALVAQRLKRTPSITAKLERERGMKLSRMQDIGGLRAVVNSQSQVKDLYTSYKYGKRLKHILHSEKDYINRPKKSGYRSIHLIYRYQGQKEGVVYDGMMIELQLRTRMQHAWATAVETMGTFLNSPLKSSIGDKQFLDFFSLASSAFAHIEQSPLVPGYENLTMEQTFVKLLKDEKKLQVIDKLEAFSEVANVITSNTQKSTYYLVILDATEKSVSVTAFGRDELKEASDAYTEAESKEIEGNQRQIVLVSAQSIDALKRAYPNYFLDTRDFTNILRDIESSVEKNLLK